MPALTARLPHTTHGIVTFDAADYQPKATNGIREFYAEKGTGQVFFAGPLLPSGSQAVSNEKSLAQNGNGVMDFLDEKLKSAGERSVLYVSGSCAIVVFLAYHHVHQLSFGSLFWPSNPAKIWAVIDVLIEKNVPFVSPVLVLRHVQVCHHILLTLGFTGHEPRRVNGNTNARRRKGQDRGLRQCDRLRLGSTAIPPRPSRAWSY